MRFLTTITLLLSLFLFQSCFQRSEAIDPLPTKKVNSIAANSKASEAFGYESNVKGNLTTMTFRYHLKDIDFNDDKSSNNPIGTFLESLAKTFAIIVMKLGGNFDIELEPTTVDIPQIDFDLESVHNIHIKRIFFEISEESKQKSPGANLKFLEKANVFLSAKVPIDGQDKVRVIHYNSDNNKCGHQCIEFDVNKFDILPVIKESNTLTFEPTIKIGDAPNKELKMVGFIELSITLDIGF